MDNAITVKERAFVVPSIEDNNSQDVLQDKWTAQDTKQHKSALSTWHTWELGFGDFLLPYCWWFSLTFSQNTSSSLMHVVWPMSEDCERIPEHVFQTFVLTVSDHYQGSESSEVTSLVGLIRGLLNDVSVIKGHWSNTSFDYRNESNSIRPMRQKRSVSSRP